MYKIMKKESVYVFFNKVEIKSYSYNFKMFVFVVQNHNTSKTLKGNIKFPQVASLMVDCKPLDSVT